MNDIENFEFMDRSTLEMLASFVNGSEIGMYVTDYYTCEILFVNKKMALYSGNMNLEEFIGRKCWTLINPSQNSRCPFCPYEKLLDENGNPTPPYIWELYVPNDDMWLKVINQVIRWKDDRLAQKVTFYDITEMKKLEERLTNLAFLDRLLQIKNELRLEQDIQALAVKPSLIVFDIKSFQKINDAYGRNIGDRLLFAVKDWVIRQNIVNLEMYRIGGDKFCLCVKNVEKSTFSMLVDTLARRFSEPWVFEYDGSNLRIFCNASIAVIPGHCIVDDEPLLNLIERTLKASKERKKVTFYDKLIDEEYKRHLSFELSLTSCIQDGMSGFEVYYQPIVEPISGVWCGIEALCRWESPELGIIPPLTFVSAAERLGLIGAIGMWVLETSIKKCKEWGLDKHDNFILDVNVSALQFIDEKLSERVINILEKYNYPGKNLCLEITESTQFTFMHQSLNTIKHLRAKNVLIGLDDFGTGYTNFYQLKSIPVDIVKIERAFITDIEQDNYQQYLFHAMSELTHTVNMKLIAEGVENRTQMDILIKNGADCLQGYLFCAPLPSKELEKHLDHFELQ